VGHSLVVDSGSGGALAELDALYLSLNLPSTASIKRSGRLESALRTFTTYLSFKFIRLGVGNPAFAALIDSLIPNFQRVNNELDLVPIVPGRAYVPITLVYFVFDGGREILHLVFYHSHGTKERCVLARRFCEPAKIKPGGGGGDIPGSGGIQVSDRYTAKRNFSIP
ncbi:hypothetical protein DFH07DRAFT_781249, partial [Mycena maculata]